MVEHENRVHRASGVLDEPEGDDRVTLSWFGRMVIGKIRHPTPRPNKAAGDDGCPVESPTGFSDEGTTHRLQDQASIGEQGNADVDQHADVHGAHETVLLKQ